MLDIQDLHIRFRNAPEGREAVKGISLHMDEGEILGLVGESGSGKTASMRRWHSPPNFSAMPKSMHSALA